MNLLRTDHPVALITGAASGIGRATADVFAAAGYRVLIVDIDEGAGLEVTQALQSAGASADFVLADVGDAAQVARAVARAAERWGRLDFVFNNAGIVGRRSPIEQLDEADLDRVIAVNLKAPFYFCKHAFPLLACAGGGSVLNISSITAQKGSPHYAAYSATKAGVVALTRSLARSSGRRNIRVNCIVAGSVGGTSLMRGEDAGASRSPADERARTVAMIKGIPLGRPAAARDVAHLALFLASPMARHIHGATLTIDGGELRGSS